MPTSFLGLFAFSTALSLVATFLVVGAKAAVGRVRNRPGNRQPRIR